MAKILEQNAVITRSLNDVGKYTLGIFLIHKLYISVVQSTLDLLHFNYEPMIFSLIIAVLVLWLSYLTTKFLMKYIPQLFGKI